MTERSAAPAPQSGQRSPAGRPQSRPSCHQAQALADSGSCFTDVARRVEEGGQVVPTTLPVSSTFRVWTRCLGRAGKETC